MTQTIVAAGSVVDSDAEPIFRAVARVRPCHPDLPNIPWTGKKERRYCKKSKKQKADDDGVEPDARRANDRTECILFAQYIVMSK